jgi:hypothetical protein
MEATRCAELKRLTISRLAMLLILSCGCANSLFAAPADGCQSAGDYRALLETVAATPGESEPAALIALADSLPPQCKFALAAHTFELSNSALVRELREIAAGKDAGRRSADLQSLETRLRLRIAELDAYPQPVDPTAAPKLKAIFARREFRGVSGESATARFQEWLFRQLTRLLSHIFSNPARVELGAKIVVWTIGLLIAGFVLWKLGRWAMRPAPPEAVREVIPFAPSARGWRVWLREARESAAVGRWREAVHSAYWAAISHLEARGCWRPDKARTPREYLRLLARSDPARPALGELTRDFETIWYGERNPAPEEWQSFLAKVESIGCR